MTPASAGQWQRILRDFVISGVATFILIHETVSGGDPNWSLILAALTLYGVPPALRLDRRRENGNGNGNGGGDVTDDNPPIEPPPGVAGG